MARLQERYFTTTGHTRSVSEWGGHLSLELLPLYLLGPGEALVGFFETMPLTTDNSNPTVGPEPASFCVHGLIALCMTVGMAPINNR
jgi:hypothetical protein